MLGLADHMKSYLLATVFLFPIYSVSFGLNLIHDSIGGGIKYFVVSKIKHESIKFLSTLIFVTYFERLEIVLSNLFEPIIVERTVLLSYSILTINPPQSWQCPS